MWTFSIDGVDRDTGYEMPSFHIHHKYEIYYEIEGSRRYFIEDAAYIVNAGSVVLIGENQIHKTAALGMVRPAVSWSTSAASISTRSPTCSRRWTSSLFLSEEHNHLLSTITVKQQNHIHGILQQLLTLQEETSPEADAMRKMLLATLLLELKELCRQQQEKGGDSGRVSNHIVDQIQSLYRRALRGEADPDRHSQPVLYQPLHISAASSKKSINLSLIEYINVVRIKAAQNLIEKSTRASLILPKRPAS